MGTYATVTSYHAVPPPAALQPQRPGGLPYGAPVPPPRPPAGPPPAAAQQQQPRPGLAAPYALAAGRPAYIAPAAPPVARPAAAGAAAAAPAAAAGGGGGVGWPPALRAWVERAFSSCVDAAARAWMKDPLRACIDDASAKGELWTRDWDTTPVPRPPGSGGGASGASSSAPAWGSAAYAQAAAAARMGGGYAGGAAAWPTPAAAQYMTAAQLRQQQLASQSQAAAQGRRGRSHSRSSSRSRSRSRSPARGRRGDAWAALRERDAGGRGARGGRAGRGRKRNHLGDGGGDDAPSGFGWAEDAGKRARREGRFGDGRADGTGPGPGGAGAGSGFGGGADGTARRRALAAAHAARAAADGDAEPGGESFDWDALTIRGTSTALEKSYFRLTSAPDPSTVRPAPVLEAALARLVAGPGGGAPPWKWLYLNDQCKALRQDLTVQRLRTPLAASVYEFHARAALEAGDLAEYNQCQTVLTALYGEGVQSEAAHEFAAYRILYTCVAVVAARGAAAASRALAAAAPARAAPAVAHALAVRAAVSSANYAAFFRLYRTAPGHGRHLMDAAVERIRFAAVTVVARAYRPGLPLAALLPALGFDLEDEEADAAEAEADKEAEPTAAAEAKRDAQLAALRAWLLAHGAVLSGEDGAELDCKASAPALFVPIPEDAVAHGDADLDVTDFLKSWAPPPQA